MLLKQINLKKVSKLAGVALVVVATSSQAGLINRGNGLIYDDVLDVTWMQDANYMQTSGFDSDGLLDWQGASNWADSLVFQGYDDWRLPSITPQNGDDFDIAFSFDGSTDRGFNTSPQYNELAHMFFNNLGNTSYFDTAGNANQPGSEVFLSTFVDAETNELFSIDNIQFSYWLDIANDPIINAAWAYSMTQQSFATGESQVLNVVSNIGIWALRDGDVANVVDPDPVDPVSSPATFGLFAMIASGLFIRRKRAMGNIKALLS